MYTNTTYFDRLRLKLNFSPDICPVGRVIRYNSSSDNNDTMICDDEDEDSGDDQDMMSSASDNDDQYDGYNYDKENCIYNWEEIS